VSTEVQCRWAVGVELLDAMLRGEQGKKNRGKRISNLPLFENRRSSFVTILCAQTMCENCGAKNAFHACPTSTFVNRVLLKHCGKCHSASYCSRICQTEHWGAVHRHVCRSRESAWIKALCSEVALRRQRVQATTKILLDASSRINCIEERMVGALQMVMADSSNCELAVQVMSMFPENAMLQYQIARGLEAVYRRDGEADEDQIRQAKRANKAGVVAALVQAMAFHVMNKDMLICMSRTLVDLNLAYRQNIAATIKANAVRIVVEISIIHKKDAVVSESIIPLLAQLLSENDDMFAIGRSAGVIPMIVITLRRHLKVENHWGFSSNICKVFVVLRFATNFGRFEPNVTLAVSLAVVEIILQIFLRGELCVDALCEGCVLISELLSCGFDQFISTGGIQCITHIAAKHVSSGPLQEYSTGILASVSKPSLRQRDVMGATSSEVIQTVLIAMREHRDNLNVQIHAINTLSQLTCYSKNEALAFEALAAARKGGAEFLVQVARREHGSTVQVGGWRGFREVCDDLLKTLQ